MIVNALYLENAEKAAEVVEVPAMDE